jgi:hypothetical protein
MRRFAALLAFACALAACPARADPADDLRALGEADRRVATIAFRLATSNSASCPRLGPATGLVLHDLSQYRPELRPVAASLFALGPGLGIGAVVSGSPAEAAGLQPNDRIVAVDGRSLADGALAATSAEASDAPYAAKLAMLEQALAQGGAELDIERAGTRLQRRLVPVAACASRFQLVPGKARNAWSDGVYVSLTTALYNFAADDDELAHNILGHRARLKAEGVATGLLRGFGDNARKVRATEIEADRLGLRLMDQAGYRVAAAEAFWRRFAGGLMLSTTHPGLRSRLAIVRETSAALAREHH